MHGPSVLSNPEDEDMPSGREEKMTTRCERYAPQSARPTSTKPQCQPREPQPNQFEQPPSHPAMTGVNLDPFHTSQTALVNALWAQLVVLDARHEALTQALVDDEDDLGGHLGAQKCGVVEAGVLPFGKVLGHLGQLDAGRRLPVAGMRGGVEAVVLQVRLPVVRRVQGRVRGRRRRQEERVHAVRGGAVQRLPLRLRLRCVRARADGRGQVGREFGREDCCRGWGDEVFCREGCEEGVFET